MSSWISSRNFSSGGSFIVRYGISRCLITRFAGTFRKPFQRNTEPFRGVFSFLKYSNSDRRVLSDYGMQLAIVDNRGVGRQDRRFHRRTIRIGKDSMERHLNNVSEIQLNLIVTQGIKESIERLIQSGFQVSDNVDDLVH